MPKKEIENGYPYLRLNEEDVECSCSGCTDDAVLLTVCCKQPICTSCADDGFLFTRRGNIEVECEVESDCPRIKVRLPVGSYDD